MSENNIKVEFDNIKKYFGGTKALDGVSFKVKYGSIHSICGENGAGKSTLMKVLSGIHKKDSGKLLYRGKLVDFLGPKEAIENGISIIHQELAIIPDLTVAENIFIGSKDEYEQSLFKFLTNRKLINQKSQELLTKFGFDIDPNARAGNLSVACQQMIEIAKALSRNSEVLILDEPTAVLAGSEVEVLFETLFRLRNEGVSIIYISHRLEEVLRISDEISIIKDGRSVATFDARTVTKDELVRGMIGRELGDYFPERKGSRLRDMALEITQLSDGILLKDIKLNVQKGEIVGLAGLVGSGRTELVQSLFGARQVTSYSIKKDGTPLQLGDVKDAIRAGIAMIPESRKEQGLIIDCAISENITHVARNKSLDFGVVIDTKKEQAIAQHYSQLLNIKLGHHSDSVNTLSGGNQQKVVMAKWLHSDCDFYLLDEPTRGVDVGAKKEIYNVINTIADSGCGVLMVSSELSELIGTCERIYVMSQGTIVGEVSGDTKNEEMIMRLAVQ
ncbi:sugar ABC transporter ATP-binding protein [Vibrio sinensis]|uniref:Sugar ABC transporter ATP-binding protein n=1 Tax=Vibrio sinensis TaxID=2302434 RepID=A0A3A6QK43_9VIBR|nr:sugar ABC transporter ATP-binding protein [Vibrio sinensis]RJX72883.1 sugar ABC transporter ATP-binding protein [Vibrio sinensis]